MLKIQIYRKQIGELEIKDCICIILAALSGIFIPTSSAGEISNFLSVLNYLTPAALLLLTVRFNGWHQRRIGHIVLLTAMMLVFTVISPFSYIAWGGAAAYILAYTILLTDFKFLRNSSNFRIDRYLVRTVLFVNIAILLLGFGILTDQSFLIDIVQQHYQSLNDELYEQMIVWNSKPVAVFGSHSTAALAYFALFALNFKISGNSNISKLWRLAYLFFAMGFLYLNWLLVSNTAMAMSAMAVIFLAAKPFRMLSRKMRLVVFAGTIFCFITIVLSFGFSSSIFGDSDANGFLGRYSFGGRLQGTYNYLIDNNFMPIGFSYFPDIGLGDNFIAEYIIKASPFGYLIILYLLWTWFRRHVSLYRSVAFFGFFVLADFAYPLLVYSRIAAVMPFYLLIWQRIDSGFFLSRSRDIHSHENV